MFRKENVRFPAEGGIEISAWLFVPERQEAPLPAITMAHGYGGTKYHGIEPMAEAFAEAGFAVLYPSCLTGPRGMLTFCERNIQCLSSNGNC
jgi:dienelactone hydrolase